MTLNGKLRSIQKNYNLLSPHERFVAALAAFSRDDESECQTLAATCPRYSYKMSDHDYRRRFDAAQRLGDLVVFDVLAKAAGGHLAMSLGRKNETPQVSILGEEIFLAAGAWWQGFKLFCADIGADFDGFLSHSSYGLSKFGGEKAKGKPNRTAVIFEIYLSMLDLTEPDPEEIEVARRQCHDFWNWATGPAGL